MEYISKKLVNKGLRAKLFYWDDTALVGTPESIAEAVQTINALSGVTGLNLKWEKCHLHGLPDVMSKNKSTLSRLPSGINHHDNFDIIYLKAPIGSDMFVEEWLTTKLAKLEDIIASITQMPCKHEASTLLRNSPTECRVMYLMRVISPRQLENFMLKFDVMLQRGFEGIFV